MFNFNALFGGQQQQQKTPAADTTQQPPNNPAAGKQTQGQPGQQSTGSTQIDKSIEQGGSGGAQTSPMDAFKDLWKDDPVDAGEGNSGQQNNQQQVQTKNKTTEPNYVELAKKFDFTRILNQEVVAKALGGDQQAFSQILNSVSQASFAASAKLAHQLAKRAAQQERETLMGLLPGEFRKFALRDTPSENPTLSHPAVAPLIDAVKSQMAVKFPEATTEDINKKAKEYISTMFTELAATQTKGQAKGTSQNKSSGGDANADRVTAQMNGEFDWAKEFGLS